jgi:homoserine kinase type II
MAILTVVSLEDARRIGREYGLSVSGVRGILAGSVNTNYECSLEGGGGATSGSPSRATGSPSRAFLRVYEEQGADGAEREIRLLDHLASRGVPTVRPLRRTAAGDGATPTLSSYAGKAAAMFPWIDGEVLCQRRVTESVMEQVGAALAKIHVAGAGFQGAPPSRFDTAHLFARIEKLRAQGYGRATKGGAIQGGEIGNDVERLADKLSAHAARERARGGPAPSALVHGDVFRDNVLWSGGDMVAVLDFESASLGSVTFDLCVTMLAWCYGDTLEQGLARALARGYVRERPLTPADRERLFDDAVFAALRFSITRITDYELRPQGTGIYKNYRRFMGRLAAIERLGAEGLSGFLEL